jgi:hypothetical protein
MNTIMIVDDDPNICDLVSAVLKNEALSLLKRPTDGTLCEK